METLQTFTVSAIIRRNKANKKGQVPIVIRINVNNEISEISTQQRINPKNWDSVNGRVKGRDKISQSINDTIDIFRIKARQYFNKCIESGTEIDTQSVKNAILGIVDKGHTLMSIVAEMVTDVKAKVGVNYSFSCYCAYVATERHLKKFLETKYQTTDYKLKNLNYKFISDFEVHLKTIGRNRQNGTIKHIQRLRLAIKLAMKQELLQRDPFIQYSITKEKVIRKPLNQDELNRIRKKKFESARLAVVKDMFLFTCYTGLSFGDAKSLTAAHIMRGVDNQKWIFIDRKKTGNPCTIPLLPPAEAIIKKYEDNPKVIESGRLLPIPSNQKFNDYLKEIAELCGIMKKLTVHIGRHTFATTIALENGVPIEIVKEILGHDKLETTEIYAKVTQKHIAASVRNLRKQFA